MPNAHVTTTSLDDPNDYIFCEECFTALPPKMKIKDRIQDVGQGPCDGCGKVFENASA